MFSVSLYCSYVFIVHVHSYLISVDLLLIFENNIWNCGKRFAFNQALCQNCGILNVTWQTKYTLETALFLSISRSPVVFLTVRQMLQYCWDFIGRSGEQLHFFSIEFQKENYKMIAKRQMDATTSLDNRMKMMVPSNKWSRSHRQKIQ